MKRFAHRRLVLLAALIAWSTSLAGCDFLSPGGPSFTGVVVDAETGEPVEGIQMSLQIGGSGFGNPVIVASVLTDTNGRFWLRDPEQSRIDRPGLYVNDPNCYGSLTCPFNTLYTGGIANYSFDNRHDIRIELRRSLD